MILYSAPSSYYSMIARLALLESNANFTIHRMDIHLAKDQLSPWYLAINPAMTVPALTDNQQKWTDSRTILNHAASLAGDKWYDADKGLVPHIETIVDAHYKLSIERLTFTKAMSRFRPLKILFPRMLHNIIRKLEKELPTSTDPLATEQKIKLNQTRLAYFTEGNLADKLIEQREAIHQYLEKLPTPSNALLFGDKISSADIVTAILFGRLQMINEDDLISSSPSLFDWFNRIQTRNAFKQADIWTHFQPWRIIFKY